MYVNGKLAWGIEPDGTEAKPLADIGEGTPINPVNGTDATKPVTTTSETTTSTATTSATASESAPAPTGKTPGDVNLDKQITVADAILIARIAAEDTAVKVTEQGMVNASVDGKDGVTSDDVAQILKVLAGIITKDELK